MLSPVLPPHDRHTLMLAFRDIYVAQLLGMLRARGFSGQVVLSFGDGLNVDHHFCQGTLVDVQTFSRVSGITALTRVAWRSAGMITLQAQPDSPGRSTAITLDDALLEHLPPLPSALPMLLHAQVYRLAPSVVPTPSRYTQAAAELTRRLARPMPIIPLQEGSSGEFWPALFHLALQGQLGISYDTALNPLVTGIREGVIGCIRKLQGNGVATAFTGKLAQHLSHWPTVPNPIGGKFAPAIPDPIHGTAPYRDILAVVETTLGQVGAAALNKRCYQQMLSTLSPQQATLFQLLK